MIFNSAAFVVFLVLIYAVYWMMSRKTARVQNIVLLVAGCWFYGVWDVRFLGLLIASGAADFFIAQQIEKSSAAKPKRWWMLLSLLINIGVLVYFKYLNFFAESFSDLMSLLGMQSGFVTETLILPLGISFYTFLKFGYILDVWRRQQKPETSPVNYFTFILFFPYMLSGPVERAGNMLPQLREKRTFSNPETSIALRIILWGYFKKVVIADRLAQVVDPVFSHSDSYSGSALAIGILLFHIQLYADFSGYSDIARGVAKLFGINIIDNFNRPFYATSLRKYWRQWHISVSTWFNQYVFSPLTIETRNWGSFGLYFSIVITFTTIGLWHGANWTFIIWGFLMGLLICGEQALPKKSKPGSAVSVVIVNLLIMYCLIWFKSDSIERAWRIQHTIFANWSGGIKIGSALSDVFVSTQFALVFFVALMVFLVGDAYSHKIIPSLSSKPKAVRWLGYYALIFLIAFLGVSMNAPAFVYFQF